MITKETSEQLKESIATLTTVGELVINSLIGMKECVQRETPEPEMPDPPYPDHNPPAAPEGMKWEYRGMGWNPKKKVRYYCVALEWPYPLDSFRVPDGSDDVHYFEAVPAAPHAVENYHLKTVIADKDATIRRLTEKLENLERHVQEEHVAAWEKVQDALGSASEGCSASLCDRTVEAIRERDTLKAETERLHTLWHAAEERANDAEKHLGHLAGFLQLEGTTPAYLISETISRFEKLDGWKKQVLSIRTGWEEVDAYIRNHKDAIIGDFVHVVCLQWLKERDVLKQRLENVLATIATLR